MIEQIDLSLVDWSRAQFALTAMFHWLFVPLTLGLSFLVAIMETIYVKTGDPFWKKTTKFWMTIFGINFAIGVATGIILEFEFGTNWSNYSWFVGDIFGAPLAYLLGCGFVPVRKPGKLPAECESEEYTLEYGKDKIEIHKDAVDRGDKILIVDDLIATAGTASAARKLVKKLGAEIVECAFIIELVDLKGRDKLKGENVYSVVEFEGE